MGPMDDVITRTRHFPTVCWNHQDKDCSNPHCRYIHVCENYFVFEDCPNGDQCTRSHEFSKEQKERLREAGINPEHRNFLLLVSQYCSAFSYKPRRLPLIPPPRECPRGDRCYDEDCKLIHKDPKTGELDERSLGTLKEMGMDFSTDRTAEDIYRGLVRTHKKYHTKLERRQNLDRYRLEHEKVELCELGERYFREKQSLLDVSVVCEDDDPMIEKCSLIGSSNRPDKWSRIKNHFETNCDFAWACWTDPEERCRGYPHWVRLTRIENVELEWRYRDPKCANGTVDIQPDHQLHFNFESMKVELVRPYAPVKGRLVRAQREGLRRTHWSWYKRDYDLETGDMIWVKLQKDNVFGADCTLLERLRAKITETNTKETLLYLQDKRTLRVVEISYEFGCYNYHDEALDGSDRREIRRRPTLESNSLMGHCGNTSNGTEYFRRLTKTRAGSERRPADKTRPHATRNKAKCAY